MRRRFKKVIAGVLSLATVLSLTACGSGNEEQAPEVTTNEKYDPIIEHVQTLVGEVDNTINVEKKITWLSWWPIDETQAAAELFKAVYGIPEEGNESYGKDANNIFEYKFVAYESRYDKLAQMVSTGNSPDMFQFELENYPYTVYKGMFQSIDGIIDTSTPEWDATRDVMEQFKWGGKNYCAITQIELNQVLWYRRSVIQKAGLQDPYDLYMAGNWNWDTFTDMCNAFQLSGEGKYAVDGYKIPDYFVMSTGTPIIGLENGQLKCNLYEEDVERSINYISTLATENYRYPRHLLNNWSTSIPAFVAGDTLFYGDGTWLWKDTLKSYATRYKWEDNDIFFVPYPKDPEADVYYHGLRHSSYMLCAGSDNIEGYKAWIDCVITCVNDEETKALSREQDKVNYDWTDEQLDFSEQVLKDLTPVFEFKQGIGSDVVPTNTIDNCVDSLIQYPYIQNEGQDISYTSLRATNEGQITARVNEMNASVS